MPRFLIALVALTLLVTPMFAAEKAKPKAWTDPQKAAAEDPDFALQGEYRATMPDGRDAGAQVVALGNGKFQLTTFLGGLPGAGWEKPTSRERNMLGEGQRVGDRIEFKSEHGGHAVIEGGQLKLLHNGEPSIVMSKVERTSPTLGKAPPAGAVVLFDGKSVDAWKNGKLDGDLLCEGVTSKQAFGDALIHVEFRLPYMPEARGQGRGNSGLYVQGRYEVQMLDSFGLEGKDNECGGIYKVGAPRVNACLPPLTWQTYDVEFTAPRFDADGKKTASARMTVYHNGILIHENIEVPDRTTAAPGGPESPTGPVFLQNHGNPVRYRNIWVVPK